MCSNDIHLNPLFSERAEEFIVHEDVALPKQRPDRVYGLRKNKLFGSLLKAQSASGRQVRDIVKCSPFKEAREILLFPFLIIEAKSAKGPDSFDQIEMQTAFPIRTALRMQEDLQKQSDLVITSALVWFFAYRSDEWRVYAGFCETRDCNTTYVRPLYLMKTFNFKFEDSMPLVYSCSLSASSTYGMASSAIQGMLYNYCSLSTISSTGLETILDDPSSKASRGFQQKAVRTQLVFTLKVTSRL